VRPRPALDLVEDERAHDADRPGWAARGSLRTFENSASPDGLEDDGAGVGIDGGVQRFDVLRTKVTFSSSGSKTLAVLVCPVRDKSQRYGLIRAFERHECDCRAAAVSGETRQLMAPPWPRCRWLEKKTRSNPESCIGARQAVPDILDVKIRKGDDASGLLADRLTMRG